MKCAELDAAQMATRSVPPSTLSLLGLDPAHVGRGAIVVPARDGGERLRRGGSRRPMTARERGTGAVGGLGCRRGGVGRVGDEVAYSDQFVARTSDLSTFGTQSDGK